MSTITTIEASFIWHATIVFKGSDNATLIRSGTISKLTTAGTFTKDVLQYIGVKDVLAVLQLKGNIENGVRLVRELDPDEILINESNKLGVVTTIYTDACIPKAFDTRIPSISIGTTTTNLSPTSLYYQPSVNTQYNF